MAIRYSGNLTIRIKLLGTDEYRCNVSMRDGATRVTYTCIVGAPRTLTQALDSPAAFDSVAHAAISFSPDEMSARGEMAEDHRAGWVVRHHRWGRSRW